MHKIKYALIVAFMVTTAITAWAQQIPSAQAVYDAWRDDAGVRLDDRHHFYLSATVATLENGRATVHVGVGGMIREYAVSIQGAISAGPAASYAPVGEERRITGEYNEFTDLSATLPVNGSANALMVTLRPSGSFSDMHSLLIYLPVEPRPGVMVQAAVMDTAVADTAVPDTAKPVKVSCPKGCFLFSYSFPPPCDTRTQYICCSTNRFEVDGTKCKISCLDGLPCPIIIEPVPDEPTLGDAGPAGINPDNTPGHYR